MRISEIVTNRRYMIEILAANEIVVPIVDMYKMIHAKSGRFTRPPKTFLNYDEISIYKFESKRLIPIVKKDPRLKQSVRLLEQLSDYFDKFHNV